MSEDNLKHWNALKQPPVDALKKIVGGRIGGMTDIKPQWRYKAMTEQFGPCGIGWTFRPVGQPRFEHGSEGQVAVFVDIELLIKDNGEWSAPIPGTGGSMFITKEKSGLHTSDEAIKMATTDALSVAMKMVGVAADVYIGNWDGTKYKNTPPVQREDPKQPDAIPQQAIDQEHQNKQVSAWCGEMEGAAKGDLATFRNWWKAFEADITTDCGKAGAAKVYAAFVATGTMLAQKAVAK